MAQREFKYSDAKSHKFWKVEVQGSDVVTTYGRVGTDGQSSTKSFDSPEKAAAGAEKLIKQKTSKGYIESTGGDGEKKAKAASGGVLDTMMFSTTKDISDIGDMSTFIGKRVIDYHDESSIKKGNKHVYRFRESWDDEGKFGERLQSFLNSPAAPEAQALVIGSWCCEPGDSSEVAIKPIVEHKANLPKLVAIFLGEIGQEENEISWIEQSDISPLLKAFPNLEMLRVRGGTGLEIKTPQHKNLRALALETGGLDRGIVAQICKAKFPNLEYLELWLGTEGYGGTTTVNDLQPIMKGKLFPKLKYLGLRNSEIADEIAGVIVNSPIIKQLETLDLSLGTLTDEGAGALMNLPTDANLQRLDVHRHFLTKPMVKKLQSLPFTTNAADAETPEDWGDGEMRFVAIGE